MGCIEGWLRRELDPQAAMAHMKPAFSDDVYWGERGRKGRKGIKETYPQSLICRPGPRNYLLMRVLFYCKHGAETKTMGGALEVFEHA